MPESKVLRILDTFELPWSQVLPPMLREDPRKRPSDLSALASKLEAPVPAAEAASSSMGVPIAVESKPSGIAGPSRTIPRKVKMAVIEAVVAVAALCVAVWLVRRNPPGVECDFARLFGPEGIFEVSR